MLITTGKVNNGVIQIDSKDLPDGTTVTLLAHEGDETFETRLLISPVVNDPPNEMIKLRHILRSGIDKAPKIEPGYRVRLS